MSSSAKRYPARHDLANGKTIHLRIFPQGTGAPVVRGGGGNVTVTREGVGAYRLTMSEAYRWLIGCAATVQMASSTDLTFRLGAVANENSASPVTVDFRLEAGSTPTEVAANANNSVLLTLTFEDSNTHITS